MCKTGTLISGPVSAISLIDNLYSSVIYSCQFVMMYSFILQSDNQLKFALKFGPFWLLTFQSLTFPFFCFRGVVLLRDFWPLINARHCYCPHMLSVVEKCLWSHNQESSSVLYYIQLPTFWACVYVIINCNLDISSNLCQFFWSYLGEMMEIRIIEAWISLVWNNKIFLSHLRKSILEAPTYTLLSLQPN